MSNPALCKRASNKLAKTSRIAVGSTFLTFASWDITMAGDDLVTVNFESYNVAAGQTYDEGLLGPIGCDLKFGGDWDAGTNPLGSPPGLYVRDDLASTTMYTSRLDVVLWTFPFLRLRSSHNSADVKGKVAFDVSGKSQGSFTFPTGSV